LHYIDPVLTQFLPQYQNEDFAVEFLTLLCDHHEVTKGQYRIEFLDQCNAVFLEECLENGSHHFILHFIQKTEHESDVFIDSDAVFGDDSFDVTYYVVVHLSVGGKQGEHVEPLKFTFYIGHLLIFRLLLGHKIILCVDAFEQLEKGFPAIHYFVDF